ncbi:hypothetical protein RFI_34151 [Reticulomyxa filosa]|uniref:DOMON domain-containing protein n=1 Tax=Reticulomyxa filosa TaxID=46433 RepID=X6LNR2_RETFI|nr:hypothetical protein RFI_34151 [Reticulomyxa filosa]|eukprot:ETO03259.1 hypothetical protein RFI_34151 [Reticulomyxa filosa]
MQLTLYPDQNNFSWYGIGFGNNIMNGTYAIVIDGYGNVTERQLSNHNEGELLDVTVSIVSNDIINGVRTVQLNRKLSAMPPYYDFSANYNNIAIIFAYGQAPGLSQHQQESSMILTREQHGHSASTSTIKALNGVDICSMYSMERNQRYAIEFGNDTMNNTYTIIIEGELLQAKVKVLSDMYFDEETRQVILERCMFANYPYYNFASEFGVHSDYLRLWKFSSISIESSNGKYYIVDFDRTYFP